jgi:hypothetical protein
MANTNGIFGLSAQWTQTSTDSVNSNNVVRDAGQLTYNYTYPSGLTSGTVSEVFHKLETLASGATSSFNLQSLTQNLLGYNVTKSFSKVYSIAIKNHSTASGCDITYNASSTSGFKEPFGAPASGIRIGPMSAIGKNDLFQGYTVGVNQRHFNIVDGGSGCTYEIAILGHA